MAMTQLKRDEYSLILCVEDEPDLRNDIVEELKASGHDAIGAGDGHEALAVLECLRPDLMLCDISMPGMDGYQLLETMRAEHSAMADVPVVFLTALSDREAVIAGKRAGVDDYLVKPIDFDLLLASVDARIAQTRRVRALPGNGTVRDALKSLTEAAPSVAANVLNILNFGIVVVDGHSEVVFANAFARALSGSTRGFSLQGRLRATTPELTSQLRDHIATVADTAATGEDAMRGMALPTSDGAGEILLVICALSPEDRTGAASVVIFATDSCRRPAFPEHMLADLFALTPTEAQVARGLAIGRRSVEIASELGISQTTVAFHLRNLFEKIGVNRQVDLVALILNALVAIGPASGRNAQQHPV